MERTAKKGNMSADGFTACKSRYGLIYDSLKDGGCQVRFGGAFINKRLNIGFCKNTASCGYRINGFVVLCIFVKACGIGL